MFDFALNSRGDLMFLDDESNAKPLKISFNITKGKAMKIQFEVTDCYKEVELNNGIRISFDVVTKLKDKKAYIVFDNEAKKQAIKIRLLTALGDIAERSTIGSELELIRHKPLYDNKTAVGVITKVKMAIADIVPEAEVRVAPYIDTLSSYNQCMNIYIYEDGFLLFKYSLKG